MKKIVVTLTFFVFSILTYGQDVVRPYYGGEEKLEEYPNTDPQESAKIKSAWLPNGKQTIFDGNGYREYEMWGEIRRYYYQDGTSNGLVLFLDTTKTRINRMGYFIDDKYDGTWTTFHSNGQISSSVTYDSGRVVSSMNVYYENAQLKASYKVNNNLELVGVYKEYYESGKVKILGQYDFILCKSLVDSNNFEKSINPIKQSSIPVGEWKEYYESGALKKMYFFDNYCTFGLKTDSLGQGAWSSWIQVNECPKGEWIEYDQNGQILKVTRFKNCILIDDKKRKKK